MKILSVGFYSSSSMRPCPFCESKDVGVKITATSIYAKCRTCLASGPVITRNRRLDRTWNSIPGKEDRKRNTLIKLSKCGIRSSDFIIH